MTGRRDLPQGWTWAQFDEVASIESDLVDPKGRPDAPHIAPNHIESKTGRLLPYSTVAADKVTSPKHRFRTGQILYSKIRPYLAKAVLVDFEGLCSADMYPVSTKLDPRFLLRWLLSDEFTARVSLDQGRTVLPKINQAALGRIDVPVPPLNEQRRIVVKLEALLSRSRRAKQALDAIPTLLAQFRQSVFAAAFRGGLTRDWRAANPDVEPASKLLERIRVERRRRWEEAELKRMQSKGKLPKDDRWKEKFEEAPPADTSGLGKVPEGWCWASLEELTTNFDGERVPVKRQDRADRTGTFPYYGASGVIDQVDDYLFDGHFLLIAEDGANLLSRSTPIAFEATGKFWVNNHAHVVQVPGELVPLPYLGSYLNGFDLSPFVTGTAQPKLTQKNMNRIPVPLAPQAEQEAITAILRNVRRCELLIEDAITRARTRGEAFEAAILGSAFRGELVPQDPNDEPATVLLERVRAQRERPEEMNSPSYDRRRRETKIA